MPTKSALEVTEEERTGVYQAGWDAGNLVAILGESLFADQWVRQPNGDFGDSPPLDRMLAGNVGDLAFVRSYIDAWRVGW